MDGHSLLRTFGATQVSPRETICLGPEWPSSPHNSFWQYLDPLMFARCLGTSIVPLWACLNHCHIDMGNADELFPLGTQTVENGTSISVLQAQQIQSVDSSDLMNNLSGHLTLNIEHHFFLHVPRRNYARLTVRIHKFLSKYNLQYNICSPAGAFCKFNKILFDPVNNQSDPKVSTAILCHSSQPSRIGRKKICLQ
jgi:hypothetical protein